MKGFQSKKTIVLLLIGLVLSFGIWFFFFRYKPIFRENSRVDIKDVQIELMEGDRILSITSPGDRGRMEIGETSVYLIEWKTDDSMKLGWDKRQSEGEYFYLYVYDLESKQEKKKLDIFAILKKYHPDGGVRLTGKIVYYRGADYFQVTLTQENTLARYKEVLIHTETEEVIDVPKEIEEDEVLFDSAIHQTGLYERVNEAYHVAIKENALATFANYETKIADNLNVSQKYPEQVEAFNDGRNRIYVRPGQHSQEEWFNILLHWFAPVGEDHLVLSVTDEETGEETPIHSYQDYLTWLEAHPHQKEVKK